MTLNLDVTLSQTRLITTPALTVSNNNVKSALKDWHPLAHIHYYRTSSLICIIDIAEGKLKGLDV